MGISGLGVFYRTAKSLLRTKACYNRSIMGKKLRNATVVHNETHGVCLWRMPDGAFLGDGDGNFLSVEGKLNNPILEEKMKKAALSFLGLEALEGKPVWLPGSRQVSDTEYEHQMERMLEGRIPDPVDVYKQLDGK